LENPVLDSELAQLGNPASSFRDSINLISTYIAIFLFFDQDEILIFITSVASVINRTPEEELPLLKELPARFEDYLPDQLSEDHIRCLSETLNPIDDSPWKFFHASQFWSQFSEGHSTFVSFFTDCLCNWVHQPTFSPILFVLIVESGIGLLKETESGIAHRFVAILFELLDSPNLQIVHFGIRAIRELGGKDFSLPKTFFFPF
jgi:hypothetical protein